MFRRYHPYHYPACPPGKCRGCDRQRDNDMQYRADKAADALINAHAGGFTLRRKRR